jgi:hypothetical protein
MWLFGGKRNLAHTHRGHDCDDDEVNDDDNTNDDANDDDTDDDDDDHDTTTTRQRVDNDSDNDDNDDDDNDRRRRQRQSHACPQCMVLTVDSMGAGNPQTNYDVGPRAGFYETLGARMYDIHVSSTDHAFITQVLARICEPGAARDYATNIIYIYINIYIYIYIYI